MNSYKNFMDAYLGDIMGFCAVLFCGLVVCGIIAIPYYFVRKKYKKLLQLKEGGATARGTVTGISSRMNHDDIMSVTYFANYSFETPDGKNYIGKFSNTKKNSYDKGDEVEVYYNPYYPQENCTERSIADGRVVNGIVLGLILLIAGICLIGAVCIVEF